MAIDPDKVFHFQFSLQWLTHKQVAFYLFAVNNKESVIWA